MYMIISKATGKSCTLRFETYHEALVYKKQYYNFDEFVVVEDDSKLAKHLNRRNL